MASPRRTERMVVAWKLAVWLTVRLVVESAILGLRG
jgi:hypothetical protein